MIYVNDIEVKQEQFGDGTLKCALGNRQDMVDGADTITISWYYDNDAELFTVIALHDHFAEYFPELKQILFMPYIPHARQDRFVSGRLFTLKSFAKVINGLNFSRVVVVDPHSDVSTALLDRVRVTNIDFLNILSAISSLNKEYGFTGEPVAVMFPDAGAAKKYWVPDWLQHYVIVGNKHRNADGRIDGYELLNFTPGVKTVVIRDDICSYGGTFAAAAAELRKRGVENIYLVVSHCENNILKGSVLDIVDAVYTTDSIFTESHQKIHVVTKYRG